MCLIRFIYGINNIYYIFEVEIMLYSLLDHKFILYLNLKYFNKICILFFN